MTKSYGIVHFPCCLNLIAEEIGKLRAEKNRELDKAHPKYKRDDSAHIRGVLGELIARDTLCAARIKFTAAPLLAEKPQKQPDLIFDNTNVDVKAVPDYGKLLLVNEDAHAKTIKKIHYYWFFHILTENTAHHYWTPFHEVSTWSINPRGYQPAHEFKIENIEDPVSLLKGETR